MANSKISILSSKPRSKVVQFLAWQFSFFFCLLFFNSFHEYSKGCYGNVPKFHLLFDKICHLPLRLVLWFFPTHTLCLIEHLIVMFYSLLTYVSISLSRIEYYSFSCTKRILAPTSRVLLNIDYKAIISHIKILDKIWILNL